ncbi:hypothetical protein JVU11DRAFT_2392 [Chiua virens]|nr:hypothetical protein JVU11DRAFT_2392 [Chiua virens]
MSASLSPRSDAVVLPSLPPSPSLLDEVFSHPRPWSVRLDDFGSQGPRRSSPGSPSSYTKGKGKETSEDEYDEDAPHHVGTHKAYPPMTDEAAETRRVEETLKRWDIAERQRRKAARDSVHHTSSPSLLSSVTHTASLVLSRRSGSIATIGVGPGATRTFKLHDAVDVAREGYAVPLDYIDRTSPLRGRRRPLTGTLPPALAQHELGYGTQRLTDPRFVREPKPVCTPLGASARADADAFETRFAVPVCGYTNTAGCAGRPVDASQC